MKPLSSTEQKFILHWGEMGSRWGINRTVAQIHALLFVSPEPVNAEEITHALGVARSNVSTSLKELERWGIVRVVHKLGDRRDHFETFGDVWEMFRIILDERKRREIDPTVAVLRECVDEAKTGEGAGEGADEHTIERLRSVLGFLETASSWYDELRAVPTSRLTQLGRVGSTLGRLFADRKTQG